MTECVALKTLKMLVYLSTGESPAIDLFTKESLEASTQAFERN